MSHPDALPDLFLDRSLGRIKVPQLLRDAGLQLVTLAEHYGVPADEASVDEEWLELAGRSGWAVFMKDTRIRYNPAERSAVLRRSVQCFCLTNQSLSSDEMARRFLDNLDAIAQACADDPGRAAFAAWFFVSRSRRIPRRHGVHGDPPGVDPSARSRQRPAVPSAADGWGTERASHPVPPPTGR